MKRSTISQRKSSVSRQLKLQEKQQHQLHDKTIQQQQQQQQQPEEQIQQNKVNSTETLPLLFGEDIPDSVLENEAVQDHALRHPPGTWSLLFFFLL